MLCMYHKSAKTRTVEAVGEEAETVSGRLNLTSQRAQNASMEWKDTTESITLRLSYGPLSNALHSAAKSSRFRPDEWVNNGLRYSRYVWEAHSIID
ncbi:hypothetical protein PGT21_034066 [Puccinia graminis f. sp. tritici]|uniref:Uncharacterized protein n=1 Tax=Puccinia graminis f. sp. tritici TaxID=56615 RepID=A0A5B0PDE9_PUCGR|nr:hypothetical protein PGT21_034066 [Puccinia graminis f. sp. tritici]KAA1125627.1 hypothetical protein PGTUg99_013601 [Puccinia graminis f. sp. tritici]